jgi:hypothetical protein
VVRSPSTTDHPRAHPGFLSEEGVDGVLVRSVVRAHDGAVDDLVDTVWICTSAVAASAPAAAPAPGSPSSGHIPRYCATDTGFHRYARAPSRWPTRPARGPGPPRPGRAPPGTAPTDRPRLRRQLPGPRGGGLGLAAPTGHRMGLREAHPTEPGLPVQAEAGRGVHNALPGGQRRRRLEPHPVNRRQVQVHRGDLGVPLLAHLVGFGTPGHLDPPSPAPHRCIPAMRGPGGFAHAHYALRTARRRVHRNPSVSAWTPGSVRHRSVVPEW